MSFVLPHHGLLAPQPSVTLFDTNHGFAQPNAQLAIASDATSSRRLSGRIPTVNGSAETGVKYIPKELLKDKYDRASKHLFLFDYDGTLTPIVKTSSIAIVSGRDQAFPSNGNGKGKGTAAALDVEDTWVNFTAQLDIGWMDEVVEIFRNYMERMTRSRIEFKKSLITWHYRASDLEWGEFFLRRIHNNLAHKRPIEVLVGKKNLEVCPLAINKGEIIQRILYPDAGFIFCAGDDKTDEHMFRSLHVYSPTRQSAPRIPALGHPRREQPRVRPAAGRRTGHCVRCDLLDGRRAEYGRWRAGA
ncbi:HAD-like protein [Imleria badia]|nr:HAD-like protein [Imleria badia]